MSNDDQPVQLSSANQPTNFLKTVLNILITLGLVYILISAVGMVGTGFKWASGGKSAAKEIIAFATNPLIGLILGIFSTALVQSSTVTSVACGLSGNG